MNCKQCDAPLEISSKFCPECGTGIVEPSTGDAGSVERQSIAGAKGNLVGYAIGVSALIGLWWWIASIDTSGTAGTTRLLLFIPWFALVAFGFFKNWNLLWSFGGGFIAAMASIGIGIAISGSDKLDTEPQQSAVTHTSQPSKSSPAPEPKPTGEFSVFSDEAELLGIIKNIPSWERGRNAAGYARLMELDPNNETYQTKYARYSAPPPTSVNSVDDLRQYLVGNWCVVNKMPAWAGENLIWKVTVSANGSYVHRSRMASAVDWDADVKRGKFTFKEGRYRNTGTKYFGAWGDVSGIRLLADAGDSVISFRELDTEHGSINRNNCAKYD